MKKWKANLRLISIFHILLFLNSCKSDLSEDGKKFLQDFRRDYKCFEISRGKGNGYEIDSIDRKYHYIVFRFTSCEKPYSYSNEDLFKNISIVNKVANTLYKELKNKDEFDGIKLVFNASTDSPYSKSFFYVIEDQVLTLKSKRRNTAYLGIDF